MSELLMTPEKLITPGLVLLFLFTLYKLFVRFIPNNRVGIREFLWSHRNVQSGIIALQGEAGFQPDVLRGGITLLVPFRDRVHVMPLVTIPQGQIGYVFARDGRSLAPDQTLASTVECSDYQDVRAFLANGGQRGPQRRILREGTYAINLAQFVVITEDQVYALLLRSEDVEVFQTMARCIGERHGFRPVVITEDLCGIVTVHDGASLPPRELIAPVVGTESDQLDTFHNNFQEPERFLAAGGRRGRQLQVLTEGTYYINRLFATVEMTPKTVVEVGNVGVVVSYTGDLGGDLTGQDYRHGELVHEGCRGVWSRPLMPGKYAFNTYAGKIVMVPTTNFILKWVRRESGTHRFDENLSEVALITKDAFEPSLPLSVVVHIHYLKAPRVVQRFGDIKKLVEQTLDPMVAAFFKNIGQTRTLIQLLQDRSNIQNIALEEMKEKFARYDLELEEVLIGTPGSSEGDHRIEDILTQLRSRQIAQEQIETYERQEKAAVKERELREAEARARQQQKLTESELEIVVQSNEGKARYQRSLQEAEEVRARSQAEGDRTRLLAQGEAERERQLAEAQAQKIRMLGEADAQRVQMLGEAEADRAQRVGLAEAAAILEQVRASGGPRYQLTREVMTRFAEAVEKGHIELVPRVVMGGGGGQTGSQVMEGLLTMLLAEKLGEEDLVGSNGAPR